MSQYNIQIKYIYHSCYSIETEDYLFIIDYFKGKLPKPNKNKKTIFISTHSHSDHFSKKIFEYGDFENNLYILSSDIKELYKNDNIIYLDNPKNSNNVDIDTMKIFRGKENVIFINKDKDFSYDDIDFYSYGSTDKGISILVDLPYLTFFHAGDLNNWIWPEDTKEEKIQMEKDFRKEVDKIQVDQLDIAFFPIDPRLKENYDKGVTYFLDKVTPEILFPMHLWDNLEFSKKFKDDYSGIYTDIYELDHSGQVFNITMDME